MNKKIGYLFNVVYLFTACYAWYGYYVAWKIKAIYPGDLPAEGREILDFYSSHPLMAALHLIMLSIGMPIMHLFLWIAMSRDFQSQPFFPNFCMFSAFVSGIYGITIGLEWANRERSY